MARKKPKTPPSIPDEPPKPLALSEAVRFGRDVKRMAKRGADMTKLRDVVARLANRHGLEPRHVDHALKGEWLGCRDCHIEPDWVLIYQITATELILRATGTHSDLFG